MNILLCITGSTGIKAIPKLIDKLESDGHSVQIIITPSAKRIIDIMIPQFHEIILHDEDAEFFEYKETGNIAHITLARWADIAVIAPCTANTYNKYILGIADNLLLSTIMAMESSKKIVIAPAMNTVMLEKCIRSFDIDPGNNRGIIVYPTVKHLSCGDFGLGALADIKAIADITYGHEWFVNDNMWHPGIYTYAMKDISETERDLMSHPGRFGSVRKHDIHTGIDLYAHPSNLSVKAFEKGEVVSIGWFTGINAGCDWWLDSQYISVKGESGIIVYGEVSPLNDIHTGLIVQRGQHIANITRILQHPPRSYIPGHSVYMLHVELIERPAMDPVDFTAGTWNLNKKRDKRVLDPTPYLFHP